MARFKDLADPALVAELRRRAEAAAGAAAAAAAAEIAATAAAGIAAAAAAAEEAAVAEPDDTAAAPRSLIGPCAERTRETQNAPGFASLIGAVMPLATPPRHRARGYRPPPHPRQREADEANALDASRAATSPGPMAWDIGLDIEGAQSFVRNGLNPDLLRKLRRGHWVVQGALDLHRHTQEEARVALGDFMALARRHGWRCVRIIHGKGLSSPNREPVLKGKVRKWLQQRDEVLAYCEPRPHAGGGGAVVVLLAGAGRP